MNYPPLNSLGTTWTGPRMGDRVRKLLEVVIPMTTELADDARHRLHILGARYGMDARTNIALTGREVIDWDLERLTQAEVK